jgi:hypothetical protein
MPHQQDWWPETPFFIRLLSKGALVALLAFGVSLGIAFGLRLVGDREFGDGRARHLVDRVEALAAPSDNRFLDGSRLHANDGVAVEAVPGSRAPVKVLAAEGMLLAAVNIKAAAQSAPAPAEPTQASNAAGGRSTPQSTGEEAVRLWQIAGIVLPPPTHPARALANSALEGLLGGEAGRELTCEARKNGTLDCLLSADPDGKDIWLSEELLRAGLVFPADADAQRLARQAAQARRGLWWDGLSPDIPVEDQLAWRTLSDATASNAETADIATSVLRSSYLTAAVSAIFLAATALLVFAKGLRDDEAKEKEQVGIIDSATREIWKQTKPSCAPSEVAPILRSILQKEQLVEALSTQCPEESWSSLEGRIHDLDSADQIMAGDRYQDIRRTVNSIRKRVKLIALADESPNGNG